MASLEQQVFFHLSAQSKNMQHSTTINGYKYGSYCPCTLSWSQPGLSIGVAGQEVDTQN